MSRERITPGTRVEWRTYPQAPSTPLHSGEVVAFVGAWRNAWDYLPMDRAAHIRATSRMDRYLVRCGGLYRCPAAALIERQNPAVPRG